MPEKPFAATVYVTDDDADVLVSLRFLLEAEGFNVKTFADGKSLLASALPEPGDCLVVDYKMRGMNGLELLRRLRDRQVDAPVVLITAYEDAAARAAALGIRHVVLKPHIEESVVAHVQDAIRKRAPPDLDLRRIP